LDNLLYILAFTAGFALFDYFAYNEFAKRKLTNGIFAPYRIFQTCVQIILIAIAWAFVDLIVAIGFTILWWTWGCDWIFHLFCFGDFYDDKQYVSKGGDAYYKSEEGRKKYYNFKENEWKCILYWKSISWAWWSLYFLIFKNGWNNRTQIARWQELAMQSFVGILIVIIISFIW